MCCPSWSGSFTQPARLPEGSEKPRYAWQEFKQYGYGRAILVGDDIIEDEASATYSNGILTVIVHKAQPRSIAIQ